MDVVSAVRSGEEPGEEPTEAAKPRSGGVVVAGARGTDSCETDGRRPTLVVCDEGAVPEERGAGKDGAKYIMRWDACCALDANSINSP